MHQNTYDNSCGKVSLLVANCATDSHQVIIDIELLFIYIVFIVNYISLIDLAPNTSEGDNLATNLTSSPVAIVSSVYILYVVAWLSFTSHWHCDSVYHAVINSVCHSLLEAKRATKWSGTSRLLPSCL